MRTFSAAFSARVGDMVKAAGIDNFRLQENILTLCGVDYVVEYCGCDEPACNGLRLRRVHAGSPGDYGSAQ